MLGRRKHPYRVSLSGVSRVYDAHKKLCHNQHKGTHISSRPILVVDNVLVESKRSETWREETKGRGWRTVKHKHIGVLARVLQSQLFVKLNIKVLKYLLIIIFYVVWILLFQM